MRTMDRNLQPAIDSEMAHPLDNPIWSALTTRQAHFAEGSGLARRFPSDVTALGAFVEPREKAWADLAASPSAAKFTAMFLDAPAEPPTGWSILETGVAHQLIREGNDIVPPSAGSDRIIELTAADAPEMLALAKLTRPGPFGVRTHELGGYLGIRSGGELVAMAGERLRTPGFTEVSAVCTRPGHTGHGHATLLVNAVVEQICRRGEVPFLHVREVNTRAIQLYRRLGFSLRRTFEIAVVRSPSG